MKSDIGFSIAVGLICFLALAAYATLAPTFVLWQFLLVAAAVLVLGMLFKRSRLLKSERPPHP